MIAVTSIDNILGLIKGIKDRKRGYLSNFFLDVNRVGLWIDKGIIEFEVIGETAFLCRKNKGFTNMFFISTGISALKADLDEFNKQFNAEIVVTDIIGRSKDIEEIRNVLSGSGYYNYTSLVRMSKATDESFLDAPGSGYLHFTDQQEGNKIFELLYDFFDPYAEQLPLLEEINNWVDNNNIIVFSDDNRTIQGFLIFELIGQTSYLRYWFVHPDHRDKKIGSSLLRCFFKESRNSKREIFWVIESNENAIKRYDHYGFRKELLLDNIMINRNICYEG